MTDTAPSHRIGSASKRKPPPNNFLQPRSEEISATVLQIKTQQRKINYWNRVQSPNEDTNALLASGNSCEQKRPKTTTHPYN